MMRATRLGLAALAAVVACGCSTIEPMRETRHEPVPSSLPEPPPWNSIEMMMMDTEIVRIEALSPISS